MRFYVPQLTAQLGKVFVGPDQRVWAQKCEMKFAKRSARDGTRRKGLMNPALCLCRTWLLSHCKPVPRAALLKYSSCTHQWPVLPAVLPAVLVHTLRPAALMLSPITFVRSLPERVYRSDYSGHSDRTKVMQEGAQDNHLIRDSKLKVYLQAIRTHPEVRGGRKALPWASVRQMLLDSKQEHYDLGSSTYSRWCNDVEGKQGKQGYDLVTRNIRVFISLPKFRHIIDRNVYVEPESYRVITPEHQEVYAKQGRKTLRTAISSGTACSRLKVTRCTQGDYDHHTAEPHALNAHNHSGRRMIHLDNLAHRVDPVNTPHSPGRRA